MDDDLRLTIEVTRGDLVHRLESFPGNKHLIVEQSLLRPLDKIASMSLLSRHGCLRVFTLSPDGSLPSSLLEDGQRVSRVFLMRSSLSNARLLASYLRSDEETRCAVIWVDRRLTVADSELERAGVYGSVEQMALSLPLLPLETDLFSLELPQSRSVDYFAVAQSLFQLESLYGQFPVVCGVGEAAMNTWKMLKVLYADKGEPRALADQPISHLLLLDRSLDPATVLMTGLTYESMIHDVFTIRCGKVSFGSEVEERMRRATKSKEGGDEAKSTKSSIVTLDNNDGVFSSVRNMHMTAVFPWLGSKAKEIQASLKKGAKLDAISDVKAFVSSELKNLKDNHRALETHIGACEVLLEKTGCASAAERFGYEHALISGQAELNEVLTFLEDSMLAEQSPWQVLCLACLASISSNGLPAKIYYAFRESFLHAYGYECLPVLHALASRRLLCIKPSPLSKLAPDGKPLGSSQLLSSLPVNGPSSSSPSHLLPSTNTPTIPYIIKRMGLIPTPQQGTVDVKNPDQMSYVFSGAFAPPLCTLISNMIVRGWENAEAERTFGKAFAVSHTMTPSDRRPDSRMRKAIMAFFVGGVTYAEKPRLYVKVGTRWAELLRKHVPLFEETYTPTWWCPSGFMQTIVRQLFRSCPTLPWEREIMKYSDGGQSALDWLHPKDEQLREDMTTPIVIFLPGITGSTHTAAYLIHASIEAHQKGWRVVVANARGLGGCELLTPKTYNASSTEDIEAIVKMINERYPHAKKIGCGFSLGGMILFNYLAKCKDKESAGLQAGMIISSPWNSLVSTQAIEKFFPRVFFNQNILKGLVDLVLPYKDMFKDMVDWDTMLKSKTIRDFDMSFVVPMYGFKDYKEYYHEAALYYKVHRIPIPLLALQSGDDCFAEVDTLPFDDICRSENVALCFTAHGGHTAFMQGPNPNDPGFIEKLLVQYGDLVFNEL